MVPNITVPMNFGRHLLDSPTHSTLELKAKNGATVRASSVILSFNSPVIDHMTTTLHLTSVDMEEFSEKAVRYFVDAAYSGETPPISRDMFRDINKMSHVFKVTWLVTRCSELFTGIAKEIGKPTYQDLVFLFDEAAFALEKTKSREIVKIAFNEIRSANGEEDFISRYIKENLHTLSHQQMELILELAGATNVQYVVKPLTQYLEDSLSKEDRNVSDNYKYLLDNSDLYICQQNTPIIAEKHFDVLEQVCSSPEDLKWMFQLHRKVVKKPVTAAPRIAPGSIPSAFLCSIPSAATPGSGLFAAPSWSSSSATPGSGLFAAPPWSSSSATPVSGLFAAPPCSSYSATPGSGIFAAPPWSSSSATPGGLFAAPPWSSSSATPGSGLFAAPPCSSSSATPGSGLFAAPPWSSSYPATSGSGLFAAPPCSSPSATPGSGLFAAPPWSSSSATPGSGLFAAPPCSSSSATPGSGLFAAPPCSSSSATPGGLFAAPPWSSPSATPGSGLFAAPPCSSSSATPGGLFAAPPRSSSSATPGSGLFAAPPWSSSSATPGSGLFAAPPCSSSSATPGSGLFAAPPCSRSSATPGSGLFAAPPCSSSSATPGSGLFAAPPCSSVSATPGSGLFAAPQSDTVFSFTPVPRTKNKYTDRLNRRNEYLG